MEELVGARRPWPLKKARHLFERDAGVFDGHGPMIALAPLAQGTRRTH
jgi:hypothetical protein